MRSVKMHQSSLVSVATTGTITWGSSEAQAQFTVLFDEYLVKSLEYAAKSKEWSYARSEAGAANTLNEFFIAMRDVAFSVLSASLGNTGAKPGEYTVTIADNDATHMTVGLLHGDVELGAVHMTLVNPNPDTGYEVAIALKLTPAGSSALWKYGDGQIPGQSDTPNQGN